MKYILFFALVFTSHCCFSQVRSFYGKVVDVETKKAIPRAIIEIKDMFEGLYCDENGAFAFDANPDSIKVVIFYAPGYEAREIAVADMPHDTITIELRKEYVTMDEVTVVAEKGKIKEGILGKKKLHHNGGAYMRNGDEVAIFLKADPRKNGTLKEVFVYITDEGIPDSKFKIHVYQKDTVTNWPSFEITDTDVVVGAIKGNEWVSFDLSEKKIPVNNGIFISVEWLSGFDNNEKLWHKDVTEMSKYYYAGSPDNYFNGMVLGMTWSYGLQPLTFINSNKQKDSWQYNLPMGAKGRGMIRISHWINPMIYCTYNYVKK